MKHRQKTVDKMASFKGLCVIFAAIAVNQVKGLSGNSRIAFDNYPSLDSIEKYLDTIAKEFRGLVTVKEVGTSHEDRDIYLVSIGNEGNKNSVWIDAGNK